MSSNFELLQQRCKKLKLKERLRYFAAVLAGAAAVAFVFFYAVEDSPSSPPQPKTDQSETPKAAQKTPPAKVMQASIKPEPTQEASKEPPKRAEEKERSYTLHVDNSYLQQLERPKEKAPEPAAVALPEKSLQKPPVSKVETAQPSAAVAATETKEEIVEIQAADKPAPKPAIHMELSANSLENMLKEYEDKPTYQRALKIADIYYDQGAFDRCAVWAKKANLLKKDDAQAWIMFARAEYAKGKKEKAIHILELFLNNKNSVEAESLLMTWRQEG